MALSGRGNSRSSSPIWPGFVDMMSALLLVLFFVLSIFMIVQFILRDTITGQTRELDALSLQVANLADALGLARSESDQKSSLITTLTGARDAADARAASFEEQVASLLARNQEITTTLATTEAARAALAAESAERLTRAEALDLALAQARQEVDAGAEAARLAAARREAVEALVASLRTDLTTAQTELETARTEAEGARTEVAATVEKLDAAEAARLVEAAAAEELRRRLAASGAELTALTLSLEAERKRAEETLTLLAAAEVARTALAGSEARALTEAEERAAKLAQANALLAEQRQISDDGQRQVALLNQQTAELRSQLDQLQGLLDAAGTRDTEAKVQIEWLGKNLNTALARVASEQSVRAGLEARERERLEAEALDLRKYRSEFFGRMQEILGEREGVKVVGDRFVFPSEVLFEPGSATLGLAGQAQIARVAGVIRDIADDIPPEIDWILRVDGHTDSTPLQPGANFRDNWELSQARALSVVRYMIDAEGIPADRVAATGFGEFQPLDAGTTPEALSRNRRIELKFTER